VRGAAGPPLPPPPAAHPFPLPSPLPSCATLATAFANLPNGSGASDFVFWAIAIFTYANAALNFCVVYRHPAFTARNRYSPAATAEQAAKDAEALEVATAHYVRTHPHEVLRVLRNMHGINSSNVKSAARAARAGLASEGAAGGSGTRAGAGAFFGSAISHSGGGGGGGGGGASGTSPRPGFEPRSRRKSFGAGDGDAAPAVPDWSSRGVAVTRAVVPNPVETGSSRVLNPFGAAPSPRLPDANPFSTPRATPARRPSMHGDK